jgi:hypothetical protein
MVRAGLATARGGGVKRFHDVVRWRDYYLGLISKV